MVQKYVLNRIDNSNLKVYVVWGPMLGGEQAEDAKKATAFLADDRATHFWTPEHVVAESFQVPLGLENEKAWDTFHIYPPGTKWQGESPPKPDSFMHVGRSLPAERRFNGETLAEEVRGALEAAATAAAPSR